MVSKRGRGRRKKEGDDYFGPNEEKAVKDYLASTDDIERNLIFNEWLKKPFDKMTESIIRKYKLYRRGFTFEEIFGDTLSDLITKLHKFDTNLDKKAYSYYGTIIKNYGLGLLEDDEKVMKRITSYEDISSDLECNEKLSYRIDDDGFDMGEYFKTIVKSIRVELETDDLTKKKVSENERKIGLALIEILENWKTSFDTMNGGNKYNKNVILETIRNYTNLSTKDIRISMKRFKDIYNLNKRK
jgi:hypothetical protein